MSKAKPPTECTECATHLLAIKEDIRVRFGILSTKFNRKTKNESDYLATRLFSEEGELLYHRKCIITILGVSRKKISRIELKLKPAEKAPDADVWPTGGEYTTSDIDWLLDINENLLEKINQCITEGRAEESIEFTKALQRNLLDLTAFEQRPKTESSTHKSTEDCNSNTI
eukprot:CFRG1220T1